MSGLYSAFRSNGAPTFYDPLKTPVEADILVSGLIFAFLTLYVSFFVVLPGIRGMERVYSFIRITLSLFIGGVIVVTNFTMTWETASISTETKYKAGIGNEIHAEVGVQIGLRGINITLKGEPERQLNETINYNEHFSWEWRQGRLGFGPFAGRFQQEYRAAQFRGLPLPILWVAEYFTFDGEGIRWGRFYRQAGWYTHIVLWLAFPLWLLANILFFLLLRYGAYLLALTGATMVTGNIIWATLRNVNELVIPFTAEHRLEFSYGGSFYVCLITGIMCIILGVVVFIMDLRFPQAIALFFNVDIIQDSEEVQVEVEEPAPTPSPIEQDDDDDEGEEGGAPQNGGASTSGASSHPPAQRPPASRPPVAVPRPDQPDDDIYEIQLSMPRESRPAPGLTHRFTKRFQKPRRLPPPPPPPPAEDDDDDAEDYINLPHAQAPDETYVNEGFSMQRMDRR